MTLQNLKVVYNSIQQKKGSLPLVPYCTNHFEKGLYGFSSPTDFEI